MPLTNSNLKTFFNQSVTKLKMFHLYTKAFVF